MGYVLKTIEVSLMEWLWGRETGLFCLVLLCLAV